MNFDFKEWSDLYQVDPEAFERRRGAVLENFIQGVQEPDRRLALEQTLFRIEMVRRRAKSPLKSVLEASNLMWESFGKLREQLDHLQAATQAPSPKPNSLRLIRAGENTDDLSSHNADASQTLKAFEERDKVNPLPSAQVIPLQRPASKPDQLR